MFLFTPDYKIYLLTFVNPMAQNGEMVKFQFMLVWYDAWYFQYTVYFKLRNQIKLSDVQH